MSGLSKRSGMSPSAGVAAWRTPARPPRRSWPKPVLAGAAALLLGMYLAGSFCLWSIHGDPRRATPLTVSRYAYYYGHEPQIRRHLLGSSVLASAFVFAGIAALSLPRRRALHGDARFATGDRGSGSLRKRGHHPGPTLPTVPHARRPQGLALAAAPRAGKGTGVVVPNALNWPGSLVCVEITAGFCAGRLVDDARRVREADRDGGEMEPCRHRGPG